MESVPPPGKPENEIRCIGESQGYRGLHVHYGRVFDHAYERPTPALTTAYMPTIEEIDRINAGEPIIIQIINVTAHPPIKVGVGSVD